MKDTNKTYEAFQLNLKEKNLLFGHVLLSISKILTQNYMEFLFYYSLFVHFRSILKITVYFYFKLSVMPN